MISYLDDGNTNGDTTEQDSSVFEKFNDFVETTYVVAVAWGAGRFVVILFMIATTPGYRTVIKVLIAPQTATCELYGTMNRN